MVWWRGLKCTLRRSHLYLLLVCIWGGQSQGQLSYISFRQHPVIAIILTGAGHSWFDYLFVHNLVVFAKDVGGRALALGLALGAAVQIVRRWAGFGHLRC